MSHMPTASSAARAIACPASFALPHVYTTSEAAERGSAIHEFIRRVINSAEDREAALEAVPMEWRHTCEGFSRDEAVRDLKVVGTEMAYVVDIVAMKVRFIGMNIGRKYGPLGPNEIPVTIDFEAIRKDGTPLARDYKSGRFLGETEDNWQMRIQSLALMLKYGVAEVRGELSYVDEMGGVYTVGHLFDMMTLDSDVEYLREAYHRIEAAKEQVRLRIVPDVRTGDHCTFCPAMPACPSVTGLARAMLGIVTDDTNNVDDMNDDDLGAALTRAKQIGKLAEDIEKKLVAMAKRSPLPAGEGYRWAATQSIVERFDKGKAIRLLETKGATAAEMADLNYATEQVSVRKRKIIDERT